MAQVPAARWQECVVKLPLHATNYLYDTDGIIGSTADRCEGQSTGQDETVFQSTAAFLSYWVTHNP